MPVTKAYGQFFAAGTVVTAGTTKAAPVVSEVVDTRTGYGGDLAYRITNSGALGAACVIMFQISNVGGTNPAEWTDHYPVASSDLLSGTVTQGPAITASRGARYQRAIAYGNTTNACTVEGGIHQVTGL